MTYIIGGKTLLTLKNMISVDERDVDFRWIRMDVII